MGNFCWETGGTLQQNIYRSLRSYNVKEKHIGSVVREILRYKQTDIRWLLLYKKLVVETFGHTNQKSLKLLRLRIRKHYFKTLRHL